METGEPIGDIIKRRRLGLPMSRRELSAASGVGRDTIARIEDHGSGQPAKEAQILATLDRLEAEMGADSPDLVVNTIELPDGTRVTFQGPADGVAEAAIRFLREHGH